MKWFWCCMKSWWRHAWPISSVCNSSSPRRVTIIFIIFTVNRSKITAGLRGRHSDRGRINFDMIHIFNLTTKALHCANQSFVFLQMYNTFKIFRFVIGIMYLYWIANKKTKRFYFESVKSWAKWWFEVEAIVVTVLKLGNASGVFHDGLDLLLGNIAVDIGQISVHLDESVHRQRWAAIIVGRQDRAQLFPSLTETLYFFFGFFVI